MQFQFFLKLNFLVLFVSSVFSLCLTNKLKGEQHSDSYLQLDKKRVKIKQHNEIDEETPENLFSFLQMNKRKLNRDEIEITPQPSEKHAHSMAFIQLNKKNLKTGKKIWDTFEEVPVEGDEDDNYEGCSDGESELNYD